MAAPTNALVNAASKCEAWNVTFKRKIKLKSFNFNNNVSEQTVSEYLSHGTLLLCFAVVFMFLFECGDFKGMVASTSLFVIVCNLYLCVSRSEAFFIQPLSLGRQTDFGK